MTKRCRHKRTHGLIYNLLDGGKMLTLSWCIDCGAVKRAIDGLWCGCSPRWETPAEARAEVSSRETVRARELATAKMIQAGKRRLKLLGEINQRLKALDALEDS